MSKHHILAAATLLSYHFTIAQDSSQAKHLEEVVITATKFPVKQAMTGKVISIITNEELEKQSGRSLGQILNQQAGLVINGALNAPGTNQTIYMRGAASGRTLILIDGIPATDPSFIYNEFDINLLSINDIERIEICRGAQSTLYGSDAIAGVINIITVNKDASKLFHIKYSAAAGNLSTFRGNLQVYGANKRLSYSLRYSKLYSEGFSSAYDTTDKVVFDRDGYNGNMANARLQYRISDQLSLNGFIQKNQYKNDLDASAFTDDRDYTINNRNTITGGGFQYHHNYLSLTGNYQYNDISRNYRDDSSYVGASTKFATNDFYGKSQFVELYASTILGSGFTFLQGADFRFANMNSKYFSISSFGNYENAFKDTSISQSSLYASLTYNGKDSSFNAEFGGRLNVHSRYGSNHTFTFNPSYSLTRNFRIFGSIASGFKTPSLFQLYDVYSGNDKLQPEKSINYEIGLQQKHSHISNRVVYFYRDIKNGLDFNYITYRYINFFKQIARGFEWEVELQPCSFLNINANYSFLSVMEDTQNRVLLNKDTTYKYALRRPRHNINANFLFQLTSAFSISANLKYISNHYDVGGFMAKDVLLKKYTILGAHLQYILNSNLKVFADFQNITNEKFFDANGYTSLPTRAIFGLMLNL